MSLWLTATYCESINPCDLSRYQVFKDIIGTLTIIRTDTPNSLAALNSLFMPTSAIASGNDGGTTKYLYSMPRGLTTDHIVHEIYGDVEYVGAPVVPASGMSGTVTAQPDALIRETLATGH